VFELTFLRGNDPVDKITLERIAEIPKGEMVTRDYLLFEKLDTKLPHGRYGLEITALDRGDMDSASISRDFDVKPRSDGITISDIALLSNVSLDTVGGQFTTGNLKMLPNPDCAFGLSFPTMFIYAEVYPPEGEDTLVVSFSILDSTGDPVKQFSLGKKGLISGTLPILNGFNVIGYPDGKYKIRMAVASDKSSLSATAEKSFTVNKARFESETARELPDSIYLEQEYKYVTYFISTGDKKFYEKLTTEGKSEYLKRWWEDRDTDMRTPENEYRDKIIGRWNYANIAFDESGGGKENGWRTDRGRIFIKFGPPDNIEISPITMGSNPWEEWDYFSLEGGVYFIFADEMGIGRFRLVHSTADGEIFNPSWMNQLNNPHMPSTDTGVE
jgi:GWxTD domain-containing protein